MALKSTRAPQSCIAREEKPVIRITELAARDDSCVTGLLIEASGMRVLVDPGGWSGRVPAELPAPRVLERLDAIVITHAHADHSAGLAAVMSAYPTALVLATPATVALLQLLSRVPDASYTQVCALPYYESWTLVSSDHEDAWSVRLLPAGHLLGAAMAVLETPEGCVVCSGDVSLISQHTVRRAARPRQQTNVLVLESTYGDREFRPRTLEETRLVEQVRAAGERGGHTLIATPALGTAQEVLLTLLDARLHGQIAGDIWVDAMIRAVNSVYAQYAALAYPRLARWIDGHGNPFRPEDRVVLVAQPDEQHTMLTGMPTILLATWNNLHGGPSRIYAKALAAASKHLILVPAGQAEPLVQVVQAVKPDIVHCAVGTYGLMSHADGAALAALAGRWHPDLVVVNHGSPAAKAALQARLVSSGIHAVLCTAGQPVVWPAVQS